MFLGRRTRPAHKADISPPPVSRFSRTVIFNVGYASASQGILKTSYGVCKIEKIYILFRDKH
jgi:hypothetical protein